VVGRCAVFWGVQGVGVGGGGLGGVGGGWGWWGGLVAMVGVAFVDRSMLPVWPALLRRPFAVRSRLGPKRRRASLAGSKKVGYYMRDALRAE